MPTLVIQLPNLPPVEHVLKDDAITIGRMKGNTIALDDISVSLSHAKLTRKEGDYYLKDLNSTNGTMLNGQSITEARLHDGDHLKFGEVRGRYYAVASTPTAQSAAANPIPALPTTVPVPPAGPAMSAPAYMAAPASPAAASSPPPAMVPAAPHSSPLLLAAPQAAKPKPSSPLVPVLAVAGVLVLGTGGFFAWKYYFSGETNAVPVVAASTPVSSPAKPAAADKPRPSVPATNSLFAKTNAPAATPQEVPALVQSLKSADTAERRRAAAALNSLGASARDAVPALREALKDNDSEVRMWAALSLINNHEYDPAVIPILVQLLQNENPVLRQVACLSLSLVPYSEAEKEPVIAALTETANKDENTEVRNAAVAALKIIVPESRPAGR